MKLELVPNLKTILVICIVVIFVSELSAQDNHSKASFKENIILSDYNGVFPKALLESPAIFIGENHTEYSNHSKQLELIKIIHNSGKKIAIGMEMFSRQHQDVIDNFINGKISETDFLKNTNYFSEWGHDYHYYKSIVDYAKENKIDLVGLNIKNEIVRKIGRHGFRGISSADFNQIPDYIDFSIEDYKNILGEVFSQHADHQNRHLDNFYFAQLIRDEFMAQSAAQYISKNPDTTIIILAGNGHIENGYGIPDRFKRMSGKSYKSILLDSVYVPDAASFFIYTKPQKISLSPRLKIMLTDDHGTIKVGGFYESEDDQKNPLNLTDIIISLNDIPVKSIADVRLFLYGKSAGDSIKINILRDKQPMAIDLKLSEYKQESDDED